MKRHRFAWLAFISTSLVVCRSVVDHRFLSKFVDFPLITYLLPYRYKTEHKAVTEVFHPTQSKHMSINCECAPCDDLPWFRFSFCASHLFPHGFIYSSIASVLGVRGRDRPSEDRVRGQWRPSGLVYGRTDRWTHGPAICYLQSTRLELGWCLNFFDTLRQPELCSILDTWYLRCESNLYKIKLLIIFGKK